MRQNRLSQRLKSKLDSFGFDALIKGVSTLVEEEPAPPVEPPSAEPPVDELAAKARVAESPILDPEPAATVTAVAAEVVSIEASIVEVVNVEPARTEAPPSVGTMRQKQLEPLASEPNQFHLRVPLPAASPTRFFEALEAPKAGPEPPTVHEAVLPLTEEAPAPVPEPPVPTRDLAAALPVEEPVRKAMAPEPLREALFALSSRLTQEAGRMASALEQRDAEEAGFYLAHVNQVLELLHTLDPKGDMARQLGVRNAPPAGRAWPLTAWTVVEFAESPFSALLPSDAGESFAREVIYAAWGISFATA